MEMVRAKSEVLFNIYSLFKQNNNRVKVMLGGTIRRNDV